MNLLSAFSGCPQSAQRLAGWAAVVSSMGHLRLSAAAGPRHLVKDLRQARTVVRRPRGFGLGSLHVAHTLDELVEMQRAADQAHAQVEQLRDQYGPPTTSPWSEQQTETYETAWRAWRDLARDVQAAVTEHAKAEGQLRFDVEAAVKKRARHPN